MKFTQLVKEVKSTSAFLRQSVAKSINIHLCMRNWMIGYYIVEYEQKGNDKAKYGARLLKELSIKLAKFEIKGLSETNLKLCRQFYIIYPSYFQVLMENNQHAFSSKFIEKTAKLNIMQISQTASDQFKNNKKQISQTASDQFKNSKKQISQTASDQFKNSKKQISQTASDQFKNSKKQISQTASDQLEQHEINNYLKKLFVSASYSHFIELIKLDDEYKRRFYELLIIKTTPSVKELERQIHSLSYERVGFSKNKSYALKELLGKIQPIDNEDIIKSHYFFEFLNIEQASHLVEESEIEQALINHLQNFILELGNGFCFEGRQKRILIGDEYFFIDLLFYHRILKCHVIIELKADKASHEHIGQLKTYLNFFKKNFMQKDDNPPVGILLVTNKNDTLVEYAVSDSDKKLFVSKYKLELPKEDVLKDLVNRELKRQ